MKFVGILLLLLLLPLPVHGGKGHGVEVRGTLPLLVDIEPGRIVSGSFLVTNTGVRADIFLDELQLPPGWKKIVPQDSYFPLKAGEQQARLIAFAVPVKASAGDYTITYAARSRGDEGIYDRQSFTVRIRPVRKLALVLEKKPGMVVAGQAFLVGFRLVNLGNGTDRVQLEIKTNTGFPVDPDRPQATLEAGQSRPFHVLVGTDGKLKKQERCLITIVAAGEGVKPEEGAVTLTATVDVLPKVPEIDLLRRLPSRLSLIATEEAGRYGVQAELSGSGTIDEAGKRRIDFLFRSPDIQDQNLYGQRDEYRFSFYGERLDLLVGDQSYSLSPLTERWRYGRGGGARFHYPKLGGGAFYLESRWQEPKEREIGTYLSYRLTDWFGLRGNFLNKKKEADAVHPDLTTNLYSLQTEMQWGKKLQLGLEYGLSDNERETRTQDHAYRFDLKGEVAGARYAFEKTYAGPRYFGYYHDADFVYSTVAFPIYQRMTGHLSYRGYRNNLDLDPAAGSATEERSYRAGITRPFSSGTTLSLDVEDFRKKDRLPASQFNFRETFVTLGIGQTFTKATLQAYVDRGRIDDDLAGNGNRELENYSIFASIFPTPIQKYGLYGRFGHDKYSDHPERTKSAGISAEWRLDRLRLGLNYQVNNFDSDSRQRTSDLTSTLDYALPDHHTFNFRNRWSIYQDGRPDDLSFFLAYTIPFDMPVGRKKSVGVVTGNIYDVQRGGKPLPNVLVTAGGGSAITDHNGAFTFPALKPGTYYLTVENGSIGLDRVTSEKMPLAVEVKGGERARVKIGVTKAGRISGRLAFSSPKEKGGGDLALVGLAGARGQEDTALRLVNNLVEIARDEELIRQMTDTEGRFSFAGLRPGKWTVTVHKDNLPPYHYLEKERFAIELQEGEEKKVTIKVVPRVRKIQIVHQETSTSAPAAALSSSAAAPPVAPPLPTTAAPASSVAAAPALPAAKGGTYTLHAGTYLMASNRLQAEKIIRRLDFEPESMPVQRTVEMIRLLVGVFPAEEAENRLRQLAGEAPDAFTLPRGNQVAIYAGSYFYLDEARDFADRLARRGIRVQEEGAQVLMTLDRVTFGSFGDRAAAEEIAAKAFAAGLDAMVVRKK